MQVYLEQKLAFLAVPKTGTTAIEMALRDRAQIVFRGRLKHMTAAKFHHRFAPFLAETYGIAPERMAVIRDPVDQIRSWYRYRARLDGPRSTRGRSFDAFVAAVLSDDPPPFAGLGSQFGFLTSAEDEVLVHHLFAYEAQPVLRGFLEDRFGAPLRLKPRNVSPAVPAPLDPGLERRLRAARAAEVDLHARVMAAGGHLRLTL